MKVTAVFLSKKNSRRKNFFISNIKEKRKEENKINLRISKIGYLIVSMCGIIIFTRYIPLSSKILYFGSNFRQAEEKKIEVSDIFNIYGIYNKENYIFNENIEVEKEQVLDPQKDAIEILDTITKDKKEQSVFGENR